MWHMLAAVALLQTPGSFDPRATVKVATRAVEGDSAAAPVARWTAQLEHDPEAQAPALGLATVARLSYHYPDALRLYRRLVGAPATRPAILGWASLGLAKALQTMGDNNGADSLYAQAVRLAGDAGDSVLTALARLGRSSTQLRIVGPVPALRLTDEAHQFIDPRDLELLAAWHCGRALLLAAAGKPEAGPEAEAGGQLARQAGDLRQLATCQSFLARDLARQGRLNDAARLQGQAAATFANIHDRSDLAAVSQWRGYLLLGLGLYADARADFETGLREGQASENQSAVAWSRLDLSIIAMLEGDTRDAWDQLAAAESLFVRQGDRWGTVSLNGQRSALAMLLSDRRAARAAVRAAMEQAVGFDPEGVIFGHLHLATLDQEDQEWATARYELDSTRAYVRQHGMKSWDEALNYYYGGLALNQGRFAEAERYLLRDLRTMDADQEGRRYPAQVKLAEAYAREGRLAQAESMLAGANDSLEAWRGSLEDRSLRLHLFDLRETDVNPGRSVEVVIGALAEGGRTASAFQLAEQRRARELLDRLARLDVLRGSAGRLEASSPVEHAAPKPTTAAEVLRALPDGRTALLEYVGGWPGSRTTLFVLTRSGLRSYPLAGFDTLSRGLRRLTALSQSGEPAGSLATILGESVLGPALKALASEVDRLIIVPDGELYRTPFDALSLADGTTILSRYSVSLVPSAAVLLRLWAGHAPSADGSILAFGDPLYSADSSGHAEASQRVALGFSGNLPRLPGSAREAQLVSQYADAAALRLRDSASEAYLKRAPLERYRVLHFATHAVGDEGAEALSALALAPGGGEDGFVGGAELRALHLNADLVVLSGCRTAGGELVRGEGLGGLTTPLLEAGARAVVATQWPIDDRATIHLVQDFYDALADGRSAGDALRAAKLASLARGARSNEWAAFTLVGDPLVRVPLRRPRGAFPAWLVPLALMVTGYCLWGINRRTREVTSRSPGISAVTHQP